MKEITEKILIDNVNGVDISGKGSNVDLPYLYLCRSSYSSMGISMSTKILEN